MPWPMSNSIEYPASQNEVRASVGRVSFKRNGSVRTGIVKFLIFLFEFEHYLPAGASPQIHLGSNAGQNYDCRTRVGEPKRTGDCLHPRS